jgi:hypothetical protein
MGAAMAAEARLKMPVLMVLQISAVEAVAVGLVLMVGRVV